MSDRTAEVELANAEPSQPNAPPPGGRSFREILRQSALGLPLLLVVSVLVLFPVGYLFYAALSTGAPGDPQSELTAGNVVRVFATAEFLVPLRNTVLLSLAVAVCSVVVGTILAWMVTKTGMKRAALWENLLVVPVYLSPLMLALAYVAVAAPRVGFLNLLMPAPLRIFDVYNFAGIVGVMTVGYASYVVLYMVAPMRALNAELEEAALVLGSSRLQIIRRIIIPLLMPAIFASFVIIFTLAAENFAVPSFMGTKFGFRTIPSEIFGLVNNSPADPNLAAALGLMLLVLTFIGIAIYRRMTRLSTRYITVAGKPRAAQTFRLRRLRWLPTAIVATWLVVAVCLPFAGLVFGSLLKFISPHIQAGDFTLANYARVFDSAGLVAIGNTLLVSVVAATVAALLGALVSYTVMRTRSVGRGLLDYISTTTVAIPGLALSLGLLWAYVRVPIAIWGTVWILALACIARFLAHSVRISSISLLPISPQLDEAGRVLGAGLFRRLRTLTFPLMRPGILSAWMLIFIFATNEISATILLYTPQSQTIAVRVWTAVQSLGAMQAFAYATVQSVIVGIVLFLTYRFFGVIGHADPESAGGQPASTAAKPGDAQ